MREVSMSRVRLFASSAVVFAVFAAEGLFVVQAFAPRGTGGAVLSPARTGPPLVQAPQAPPPPPTSSEFDRIVAELEARAAREPGNAEVRHLLARQYWSQARSATDLTPAKTVALIEKGLEHADRALRLRPDYVDVLVTKNLLLRSKAQLEPDATARRALIADADTLRDRAIELREAQNAWNAIPPNALRIGSPTTFPKKTKHVAPGYPPEAREAGISGTVTVETIIGADGKVRDARVRRSVPPFDAAAVSAVKQWEFAPTLLNGEAVPVVATMTVTFAPDRKKAGETVSVPSPPPPPAVPPLPPSPPGHEPFDPAAVRIGDGVTSPAKLVDVRPVYPPAAKESKVQGVVTLEVLIGHDGKVERALVRRSVPELDQAALDAVRQWVFAPTRINGEPAKAIVTATIKFALQ